MNILTRVRKTITAEFSFLCILPALIWQVLFFCIPIFFVLVLSLASSTGFVLGLDPYMQVLNMVHARIILRSLALGLTVTTITLLCAYPTAYFIAIRAGMWRTTLRYFLMVPLWTNFLVQIYSWSFLLDRNGLINTILVKSGCIADPLHLANNMVAVIVVMSYCYLPFMIMPLYSALEAFDVTLLEASSDLGASAFTTFIRVTLPLSLSGIRTGVLLTLVLSYGEFAIPALVGGGKHMMVGSLIYYYFLIVKDPCTGAAFTCLSGAVLLIVCILIYYLLTSYMQRLERRDI